MLIVQGVFRSGTTLLFRSLRRAPSQRCYYEPLHPCLLDHVSEADTERPNHEKSPLYREYRPIADRFGDDFRPDGASEHTHLRPQTEASELASYLHLLADSAPNVVLQFNRAFWMSRWLHSTFPKSAFVHLVRDPRSVVWSQLTTASGERVRMDWPLLGRLMPFSSGNLDRAFSRHTFFGAYHLDEYFEKGRRLLEKTTDDILTQALRRLDTTSEALPYVKALALWGAQVETCHYYGRSRFGTRYLLLRYEDFCQAPGEHLRSIYALQDRSPPKPVLEHARATVDTDRSRHWSEVPSAARRFRQGIHRAQIADLMHEVGYDLS